MRREVREESGVQVGAVDIVGSQPWPVGEWSYLAELAPVFWGPFARSPYLTYLFLFVWSTTVYESLSLVFV